MWSSPWAAVTPARSTRASVTLTGTCRPRPVNPLIRSARSGIRSTHASAPCSPSCCLHLACGNRCRSASQGPCPGRRPRGLFDEAFLAADATGARAVSRPIFLLALPKSQQMAEVAGIGPAALSSLTYQELDDHYVLARTEWTAPSTTGGDAGRLCSSFLD